MSLPVRSDQKTRRVRRTNEPGTCLWCGVKLKHETRKEYELFENGLPNYGKPTGRRVNIFDAPGYAGNSWFCTLSCGYKFGCNAAFNGYRFVKEG
jgi:hypothetical protein